MAAEGRTEIGARSATRRMSLPESAPLRLEKPRSMVHCTKARNRPHFDSSGRWLRRRTCRKSISRAKGALLSSQCLASPLRAPTGNRELPLTSSGAGSKVRCALRLAGHFVARRTSPEGFLSSQSHRAGASRTLASRDSRKAAGAFLGWASSAHADPRGTRWPHASLRVQLRSVRFPGHLDCWSRVNHRRDAAPHTPR